MTRIDQPSTPPTPRGEQARQQLLAAAIELFGELGVKGATTRDIALRAGQNIAAITYYFGSKEGLYQAVAQWIADYLQQGFQPLLEEIERYLQQPAPQRDPQHCRLYIQRGLMAFSQLMTQQETLNLSKIMSREQLAPTAAYQLIHQQVIAPLHQIMTQLLAGYTGAPVNAEKTILHTHALLGEVLAFRVARETIRLQAGWQEIGAPQTALINEVLSAHIDFILNGIRTQYPAYR